MNMKSEVVMEFEKNERLYKFCMPMNAPYGEAYDAAFEALQEIVDLAKKAAERAKRQDEEKAEKN